MKYTFNEPQRQSPLGILVYFSELVYRFAKTFWILLMVLAFKIGKEIPVSTSFLVGTVLLIGFGIISFLRYYFFTFYIDFENQQLRIKEGIFSKNEKNIPLQKIQQVHIKQDFLQQIIQVCQIKIETAGSSTTEVSIKAVNLDFAQELREVLLQKTEKTSKEPTIENLVDTSETTQKESSAWMSIGIWSLLKMSISSNYGKGILFFLAFAYKIDHLFREFFSKDLIKEKDVEQYIAQTSFWQIVPYFVAILAVVILVLNGIIYLIGFFNYKIYKQEKGLLFSFGLLQTNRIVLHQEKVQWVEIAQNYLQKKMNVFEFKINQAGAVQKNEKLQSLKVPGCDLNEKNQLLALIFGQEPQKGVFFRSNFRKLGFDIFLKVILPFIVYFFIRYNEMIFFGKYQDEIFGAVLGLMLVYCCVTYYHYRLYISDDFIIKESGFWDVKQQILPLEKLQGVSKSQLFWHKSVGISSVKWYTASGDLSFDLISNTELERYMNLWLYKIEKETKNYGV